MSVESEIERIKNNISNAYSKIAEKGGTLPEIQKSSNLANAIDSISLTMNLQEKTVTPSEQVQEVTADKGYDALSKVTVEASSSGGKLKISYGLTPPINTQNLWVKYGGIEPINSSIVNYRPIKYKDTEENVIKIRESGLQYSNVFYVESDNAYAMYGSIIYKQNLINGNIEKILDISSIRANMNSIGEAQIINNDIYILGNYGSDNKLIKINKDFTTYELFYSFDLYDVEDWYYNIDENKLYYLYSSGVYLYLEKRLLTDETIEKITIGNRVGDVGRVIVKNEIAYILSIYSKTAYFNEVDLLTNTVTNTIMLNTDYFCYGNVKAIKYDVTPTFFLRVSYSNKYLAKIQYINSSLNVELIEEFSGENTSTYYNIYGFDKYIVQYDNCINANSLIISKNTLLIANNIGESKTFNLIENPYIKLGKPRFYIGNENNYPIEYEAYYYSESDGQWLNILTDIAYSE